jgi:hypothetical protein
MWGVEGEGVGEGRGEGGREERGRTGERARKGYPQTHQITHILTTNTHIPTNIQKGKCCFSSSPRRYIHDHIRGRLRGRIHGRLAFVLWSAFTPMFQLTFDFVFVLRSYWRLRLCSGSTEETTPKPHTAN